LVQRDLANQEAIIQELNDIVGTMTQEGSNKSKTGDRGGGGGAGDRGSPLLEKCQEMNESYAVVQVMTRDRLNELQDRLKEVRNYIFTPPPPLSTSLF